MYQLKFVIDARKELAEVDAFLEELPPAPANRVLLMPQGVSPAELDERAAWLKPHCEERGFVFCPRKQIEWYGTIRGT